MDLLFFSLPVGHPGSSSPPMGRCGGKVQSHSPSSFRPWHSRRWSSSSLWWLWLPGSSAHRALWPAGKEAGQTPYFLVGLVFARFTKACRAANRVPPRYGYEIISYLIWRKPSESPGVCGLARCLWREESLYFRRSEFDPKMLLSSPKKLPICLSCV